MDYNKIKLGLLGKFKVWNARRIAEAQRNQQYKDEGELLEVDYSVADKLEADLLTQKRIKRATKDASKLYKKVYGKNNDGVGEADFIEDYLVENGLKQKMLPSSEPPKKHSFMEKYSTVKTEEELSYERETQEKAMYYEIDGVKYKIPFLFSYKYFEQMEKGDFNLDFPLTTNDGIHYVIKSNAMAPEAKHNMLKKLIDSSLSQIGEETYIISAQSPNTELKESFPKLTRQASMNDYYVKKLYSEGNIEEANSKLERMVGKILQFYDEMSKDPNEEIR